MRIVWQVFLYVIAAVLGAFGALLCAEAVTEETVGPGVGAALLLLIAVLIVSRVMAGDSRTPEISPGMAARAAELGLMPAAARPSPTVPPTIGSEPAWISGLNFDLHIDYRDFEGAATRRRVTVRSLEGHVANSGAVALDCFHGFCHLRNETRTFRLNRVTAAADEDGVVIPDLAAWMLDPANQRRKAQRHGRAKRTNPP